MKLVDVLAESQAHVVLYELLKERQPEENISHREMPSWDEHCAFVGSEPYDAWYLIQGNNPHPAMLGDYVGSIYLTELSEVGVWVFRCQRSKGYGRLAVHALMLAHPRPRYLFNVNPKNRAGSRFAQKLGGQLLQATYEVRQ